MELLDYYDSTGKHIGVETREKIHSDGLWHQVVHCWIYDADGNIYFQLRADNKKMFTTASGHVAAGESLKEAFSRETKEEIGIDVETETAKFVMKKTFEMDKGNIKDRVFPTLCSFYQRHRLF